MAFVAVAKLADLDEQQRLVRDVNGLSLLVIKQRNEIFVIENRCGHFGVPLVDGEIQERAIICRQHRVRFDLRTGAVLNDYYDDCDPVRVFESRVVDGEVGIEL